MMLKLLPILIAFHACATAREEPKTIVGTVSKTVDCAFDEAKVLKDLTLQCRNLFKKELNRFKEKKCKGEKYQIEQKLKVLHGQRSVLW